MWQTSSSCSEKREATLDVLFKKSAVSSPIQVEQPVIYMFWIIFLINFWLVYLKVNFMLKRCKMIRI